MSFPRYESYKDSGVEWLGEVPEHWDVKRLKQVCEVFPSNVDKKTYENETPILLCNYTDVYYNENITPHIDFMAATASADQIKKFTLRGGDTIITKDSETADDIAIAAYVPQNMPGVICGYHLSMIRPREATCGAFMKRLFDSIYVKSCCAVYANGLTRVGLGQYALDNLEMPFPPKTEQQTIAAFLDRETAKIDALIDEQQRLIELLKEKRQSVISHAVTKGLNPNVPMKDSGVEWLGDVPEHWEVLKGGAIGRIFGSEQVSEQYVKDEGELPFIKVGSLSLNDFEIEMWNWFVDPEIASQYKAKSNFIVFPKRGAAIFTNKVNIVEIPSVIDPNLMGWEMGEKAFVKFFAYVLKSRRLDELADVSTVPQINNKHINPEKFPVPPLHEQQTITSFLDNEAAKIDALTTEAKTVITLLQERRTALISAAVTGKIDVRGLVSAKTEVKAETVPC